VVHAAQPSTTALTEDERLLQLVLRYNNAGAYFPAMRAQRMTVDILSNFSFADFHIIFGIGPVLANSIKKAATQELEKSEQRQHDVAPRDMMQTTTTVKSQPASKLDKKALKRTRVNEETVEQPPRKSASPAAKSHTRCHGVMAGTDPSTWKWSSVNTYKDIEEQRQQNHTSTSSSSRSFSTEKLSVLRDHTFDTLWALPWRTATESSDTTLLSLGLQFGIRAWISVVSKCITSNLQNLEHICSSSPP
jgi:hypothetical protein